MNITRTLLAATVAVGMIGATTATASAYNPGPARSPAACDQYAKDYANWAVGNRAGQAAFGGVVGAGVGALVGGFFFGTPLAGAAIGGGIGVAGGAMWNQPQWQAEYNNAYSACIYGYPLGYPY